MNTTTAIARTDDSRSVADVEGLGVITVISPEDLQRQDELVAELAGFGEPTEANIVDADALVGRIALHDRGVEKRREKYKAPFLAGGRFVDKAAADATIDDEKPTGVYRLFLRKVAVIRRAMEDRAAAEVAERVRIEAEAAAKIARAEQLAEEAETVIAELEETANPDEAASLAELRASAHRDASVAQHEAISAAGSAWVRSAAAESRPMPKLGTNLRKSTTLEIDDVSKIPTFVNGKQCMKPDTAQIRKLLDAGVEVPGCRLVEDSVPVAGRR